MHVTFLLVHVPAILVHARIYLRNLAVRIREAAARGERFALPALAELLVDPAFAPLGAFLRERGADLAALQGRIEVLVEETRDKG